MGFYFFTSSTLHWGIFCAVLASIGYSGSLVFYDAYLPEIATADQFDKTSARGYSFGYYGSVIMMVIALVFILAPTTFGFPNEGMATRFSFILVGLWWIGFAQIPFKRLPDNPFHQKPEKQKLLKGYHELKKVWSSLKENRDVKFYIIAYFFYNMGVQTVMYLAATFGAKELKLPDFKLIGTVLLIQIVAAGGAHLFARFSTKRGNRTAIITMICFWILICFAAYFIENEYQFYAVAFAVGIVMGGIQALSRATYSKLIPTDSIQHASYFSFFDVTYNLSIVFGTFSYGLIEHITGSMRNSTIALALYFVIGLILFVQVKSKAIQKSA
jgi:UMF1 family MFS transporter